MPYLSLPPKKVPWTMRRILTVVIGFVHDFAAGCWAATVLAVFWLSRQNFSPEVTAVLAGLKRQFFYLGIVCVLTVLVTGAGRTFTYVGNVYGEEAEEIRRKMLIIKHILLVTIFGIGIYWQYLMIFR